MMAWPQTELGVRVELQLGGVWTDITQDVRLGDRIGISRGRADEAGKVDHAKCSLVFDNTGGKYSARNPLSPYYGLIGRNTPIRVSVLADEPRIVIGPQLPGSIGATTPDAAALDVTGDIDVRFDACLMNWHTRGVGNSVELCGKSTGAGNQRSWALQVRNSLLHFEWSTDGTDVSQAEVESTAPLVVPASGRLAVRATLDVNNGGGGHTVTFYTAPSVAGPWTQLGAPVVRGGVTSIYASSAPLWVGSAVVGFDARPCQGEIYHCEVRNGIGGTLVADLDAAAVAVDATAWTDAVGRAWTLQGAVLHDRRPRFCGEVSEWPPRWDVTGADRTVPVNAAGVMRRLNQGASPLRPATHRALLDVTSPATVAAYWPLNDGSEATQAGTALPHGRPMTATGSITFGQEGGALGGAGTGVGTGDAPGVLTGTVEGAGAICMTNFWIHVPAECTDGIGVQLLTPSAVYTRTLIWVAGTAQTDVGVDPGNLGIEFLRTPNDAGGGGWPMFNYDLRGTGPHMVTLCSYVNGGNRTFRGWLDGVRYFAMAFTDHGSPVYQVRVGTIPTWYDTFNAHMMDGGADGIVSDLSVQTIPFGWSLAQMDDEAARLYQAGIGYAGETAKARITRLCHESGIPVWTGDSAATAPGVGAQSPQKFLELLAEAAEADGGIQHEPRDVLGIYFRDHATLISQPVAMRLAYGHLSPDLEPTDDDAHVRNDVTASRPGGSSVRRIVETGPLSTQPPPHGLGVYDEGITVNVATDADLADAAGWRAHQGTWDDARYPVLRLDLRAKADLVPLVAMVDVGDRAQVGDLIDGLDPADIDVILQGYSETIGEWDWDIEFNATPARLWDGAVVGDDVYGRVDTDGCALAQPVDAEATQIWAYTPTGPTWASGDANLIANNSFEGSADGWAAAGGTMARINSLYVDGAWSLQLTPDGATQYPALQYQLTPVQGDGIYRASAWMRCTTTRPLALNVNWYNSAGGYLDTSSIGVPVTGGQWTYATGLVTAPAGASFAQMSPTNPDYPAATDRMTVDDVRLSTTDGRALDVVLNRNPGYDDFLNGWTGVGGTLVRVNNIARIGAYSARLTPDGVTQYPAIQSVPTPVQGGRTYLASAWLRCATTRQLAYNVNWHTVRGAYLGTSTLAVAATANVWARAMGEVTAPAGAQLAILAPTVGDYPPPADVLWADDVRLAVPVDAAQEFGYDVMVGGEVMTVTGVADRTSPQLLTVTRAVNGITKPHAAGTDLRLLHPAVVTY